MGHLQQFSNAHGGLQESIKPKVRDKLQIEKIVHHFYLLSTKLGVGVGNETFQALGKFLRIFS